MRPRRYLQKLASELHCIDISEQEQRRTRSVDGST